MPPGMIFDRDQGWEQGRCCGPRVMSDNAADGVIRNQLPDDTLLVFLSDTHIGGAAGSDIFESAAELILLLEDLNRHQGPVELVLAGDFLDVLRMDDADSNGDRLAATITRPEYQGLFAALRALDGLGLDIIVVEGVREQGLGVAVMDRLRRAASPPKPPTGLTGS